MKANKIKLTSSEIASLWTAYMNDSMSICFLAYFLKDVEDEQIRTVIQYSYDLSAQHVSALTELFESEGFPQPTGFSMEKDLNINAPRLYTDMFMLSYINYMAKFGLLAYSGFIAMSARKDIRSYFIKGIDEASKLYDMSSDVALSKGLYVRAPYIPYPEKIDFVDSKKYLSGLSPFSSKRPLNAVEISHLFMNIQTNVVGVKLSLSFAQTSPIEKIQKLMLRGCDISEKHIQIFTQTLIDNDIQPPVSSDVSITNSKVSPFSDKLKLFLISLLTAAGTGNYATAAAASQRSDLVLNYERLSLEVAQFAKDGADLMIKHEWLEQPPGTVDKRKLTTE